MTRFSVLLVFSALLPPMHAAPALPPGITQGASVEGITEYHLSNGLRVLLFPDPTKTTTTVNITYLVGSRNEGYGETGMAHLLEHMLFKGTPAHQNIPQELTEHGARPNGTTWFDRTNYFETFNGTDTNLDWALNLEADRMLHSNVLKKDLDTEMTVVRNEFEMNENNPATILEERVFSTAYLWHNYGKSTIGARSDIERVPIERLQAFYHLYYQPDNAVLTIAGHVDEARTLALVAKYFGAIPKPERVLTPTYTEEPAQDGERTVVLRRVGDAKVVMIGVHVPALAHPDGPIAGVLGDILTNAPSGRLYQSLVVTKKAGHVGSDATDTREPGMLNFVVQAPKTADLDDIEKTFVGVLNDTEAHPPTKEEVERSKTKLDSRFDLLLRNSERLGLFLSEYIAAGDWRLAFLTRDRISQATQEQVDAFARTYLKPDNRTIGLFIPTDKPDRVDVPAAPDIAALVKDYKGSALLAQGESFDPSPLNVDKRTVRGNLEPGIKLALISKKTRGSIVNASFNLHFGDEQNLRGKDTAATLGAEMLMRGSARHSRQQIADSFDKLKAQVRISGGPTGTRVGIQTTRVNLPAVLQLIGEVLREPAFPASEFEALRQERITSLDASRSEPQAVAMRNQSRITHPYPNGDVRYVPTLEEEMEDLKSVQLDDIKKFYNEFYGASHSEFAAVGDFEPEDVEKNLSTLFKGWTGKQTYARVAEKYKEIPVVHQKFDTPDKPNAVLLAFQPVKISDDDPDYPSLVLANYMFGGGFLNSRLAVRIRQKDGLSYGIGSYMSAPPVDDSGMFFSYAISAPQNSPKVQSDILDELKRARSDGFTQQELDAAKSGWLQSRQVSRGQDGELSSRLATEAFWGRTMQWDANFEARVFALTPDQVNAAIRKYIDPAKISVVQAGELSKMSSDAPAGSGAGAGK
ncbi:MAG TPA: pitrilysin family protein [Bryobacteraceae bacterium]|nr:pitrilysin family protein [Bryobacteraceae bacterium]